MLLIQKKTKKQYISKYRNDKVILLDGKHLARRRQQLVVKIFQTRSLNEHVMLLIQIKTKKQYISNYRNDKVILLDGKHLARRRQQL